MLELVFKHVQHNYNFFPKVEIGERDSLCRFCKLNNVKFNKKKAHSFPEFLGNKSIFTANECDECNAKFSKIEKNLSDFIPPTFITRLKGKKGYRPNYLKGGSKIYGDDQFITLIQENSSEQSSLNFSSQAFDMVKVYKAILKSLISILPDEKLKEFHPTLGWLTSNQNFESLNHFPIFWCGYRMPDVNFPIKMEIELTRETSDNHIIYLLYCQFNNYFIFFPFSPTSKLFFKAEQIAPKTIAENIHYEKVDCRDGITSHSYKINLSFGEPDITSSEELTIEQLNNILKNREGNSNQ
ncbi:hypothetical protein H5183_20750 [Pseudoalteromonas sp. SR44-8]|uniref:hypothetical protein n=1 Tax=Pseudoalteromonas sp. SR44-8 TaxID=2760933 RepID=UPI0016047BB1|nr:hypothetical protein [Pseudoalteromonas sp. SR44-8]MBB1303734.1 hypothetical protein [Pseudoalteromonas sp. SR44-8]